MQQQEEIDNPMMMIKIISLINLINLQNYQINSHKIIIISKNNK